MTEKRDVLLRKIETAEYQCDGWTVQCREDSPNVLLTPPAERFPREAEFALTARDVVAVGALMRSADLWFERRSDTKRSSA